MVDKVECFGEVEEHCMCRLLLVFCFAPVLDDFDYGVRCTSARQETVLVVVLPYVCCVVQDEC